MKKLLSMTAPLASVIWAFSVSAVFAGAAGGFIGGGTVIITSSLVPEPASLVLLGSGLAGLAAYRWYRKG